MSTSDPFLHDSSLRSASSSETHERQSDAHLKPLSIPKNRSTGDLLGASDRDHYGRLHPMYDSLAGGAGAREFAAKSPVIPEYEHGLGISGLRRIRQHPPSRAPSFPTSPSTPYGPPTRSASMTLCLPHQRHHEPSGPSSPILNTSEDLSRFPSESLHSFSFSHQSEDALHSRHNALKHALDFMQERIGYTSTNQLGVMTAQAKISGDIELQNMMELLLKANLSGKESPSAVKNMLLSGPLTGPAELNGNVFEQDFILKGDSPQQTMQPKLFQEAGLSNPTLNQLGSSSSHPAASVDGESAIVEPTDSHSLSALSSINKGTRDGIDRGLKRAQTDLSLLTLQTKLVEALAKPYKMSDTNSHRSLISPKPLNTLEPALGPQSAHVKPLSFIPGHNVRWVPAAQAIFSTETTSPWTILAANDLACLIFGVTKSEVKSLSMLEVFREDRRAWLEDKLRSPRPETTARSKRPGSKSSSSSPNSSTPLSMSGGITAKLLSKPSWRQQRAQTGGSEDASTAKRTEASIQGRGVILCGDIVPIRKRNGVTGAASLWIKEKKNGLIWVLEEIAEDVVHLALDEDANISKTPSNGSVISTDPGLLQGTPIHDLIPGLPLIDGFAVDKTAIEKDIDSKYYAAKYGRSASVPVAVSMDPGSRTLRVTSFPHIAGIMVLQASTLQIINANPVFSAALFGRSNPRGKKITDILPQFDDILEYLTEEDKIRLVDGIVVPEHSFQRAQALVAIRDGNTDAAEMFLRPTGLVARHRDGSDIHVDIQMRVVRSEPQRVDDILIEETSEDSEASEDEKSSERAEIVYALWITYSRKLHSAFCAGISASPTVSRPSTPHHQPSPGQESRSMSPEKVGYDEKGPGGPPVEVDSPNTTMIKKIQEAASQPISGSPPKAIKSDTKTVASEFLGVKDSSRVKKRISDFVVLEDMGQGAYGQVKLARYTKGDGKKVVLKYVTKRRILVDTWTRDRRLGTVPLEIHVLEYLRKDGLRHPNIVEMIDFFEDDINYYIEMVPHGLPGMDLFDYIEMRTTTDEDECRNIFLQVVAALHHLHTKALVVHRDIKDENIILDGDTNVKLIDFGSAAYIKNGPFDVFVGTIDYAAPEVLQGKSYRGKEQDIWALGILLYTLVYKENPFYSIDEILDHELRIPWVMSEDSIDLIKAMLNRDVDQRLTVSQILDHPWCRSTKAVGDLQGKS